LIVAVIIVPVLGVYYSSRRHLFRVALAAYGLAFFLALAGYGQMLGGAAFGLMAGIHGLGISEFLNTAAPADSRYYRLRRSLMLIAAVGVIFGFYLGEAMQRRFIPVKGREGVLLINKLDRNRPLTPGEVVAYELKGGFAAGLNVVTGTYLGQVLGGPGSTLKFETGAYVLNGSRQAALPHMPGVGQVVAGPDQSLIWPIVFEFSNRTGMQLPEKSALVDDSALVGRPFKRWFWRTFTP